MEYLLILINVSIGFSWYFPDIDRLEAENILKRPYNGIGTYMIRESKDKNSIFILSVLTYDESNERHVMHYLIKTSFERSFFIYDTHKFNSIDKLIEFYSCKYIYFVFSL